MTDTSASPTRPAETEPAALSHRRLRWWHLLLIFLSLVIAAFLLWRVAVGRAVEAELQAIRDAGYPATGAELDQWYERVPDDQNAAVAVLEAVRLMREPADTQVRQYIPRFHPYPAMPVDPVSMPDEMASAFADYIELNREALAKLHEAVAMERSRYPAGFPGFSKLYDSPHINDVIRATKLLHVETVLHLHHDRPEDAADSALAMLRLAETLKDEPTLLSQLNMRRTVLHTGVMRVETVVQHNRLSDRTLAELAGLIDQAESLSSLKLGTVGVRAYTNEAFEDPNTFINHTSEWWERVLWRLHYITGLADYEHLLYIKHMNELFNISRLPLNERIPAANELDIKLNGIPKHLPISRMMLDFSAYRMVVRELQIVALLRTARAALTVERYRLAHGRLPEKLEEVAPDFIDALPADPFTGDPLKYRTLSENGFVVYSVGQDQSDDSGAKTNAAGERFEPGSDIAFEVRR